MIKQFLIAIILTFPILVNAQFTQEELMKISSDKGNDRYLGAVTIGILQGGGSLLGADVEFLATDKFGIQLGAGLVGYGFAANYHFEDDVKSSFLSFGYWHQGIGASYTQSLLGPSYVYRGKKWFTAQIGLGYRLEKGPAAQTIDPDLLPPVQLLYSIGAYWPLN